MAPSIARILALSHCPHPVAVGQVKNARSTVASGGGGGGV